MKLDLFFAVLIGGAMGACHSVEPAKSKGQDPLDSTRVMARFISDKFKVGVIDRADLKKKFDEFYEDKSGHFFIRSFGHKRTEKHEFEPVEVFVEVPKLDSATYKVAGSYIMDSSKVICVFQNSDGGNYVWMKDADPRSFQAFKNAFGGKDKDHVFYNDKILEGLNPSTVKVYSNTKNCSNCTAYFTDGKLCYSGDEKNEGKSCSIPPEYKFIE